MLAAQLVGDLIREYWPEIAFSLLGLLVGALWGRWRARRQWQEKEFLHRLNVSLNTIDGGTLRIRTVLEKDLQAVLLNKVAVDRVLQAASRTTPEDPLLPLEKSDVWFLLNGVLNEISERFAEGFLRKDLGLEVTGQSYLICLTNEISGAVRTHKIRAMLVRRDRLENLPEAVPAFESPNHETRWDTLKAMAAAYAADPNRFLEVEIAL